MLQASISRAPENAALAVDADLAPLGIDAVVANGPAAARVRQGDDGISLFAPKGVRSLRDAPSSRPAKRRVLDFRAGVQARRINPPRRAHVLLKALQ